jgi:hypothetical protein
MATTQLSDVIDITVFQDLPAIFDPRKTNFYESGIVTQNALLNSIANMPGKTAELPFWNDLDPTADPNLSNDDPTDDAVPGKIDQGEQICRKAYLNYGWSTADLVSEIAMGESPMTAIRNKIDRWWMHQWQKRLVKTCLGIYANNVADYSSDMVYDASGATNADITVNTVFTRANFTSAAFTLGDSFENLTALAVHPVVYKRMVDNDEIDFIPDSDGRMTIPTYLGLRVVYDGNMPYTPAAGAGDADAAAKYTSILFGQGAFGYGEGAPLNPVEISREASQGNGAGVETLWTRKTWILHPFGFKVDATPAADSFTLTELAAAATWDRVVDRKSVPLAFLVTNG